MLRRFAGDDAQAVVVVEEAGGPAPAPRRRLPRARRDSGSTAPSAVPLTRVTVVSATPLVDGSGWLADPTARVEAATPALERLVAAHRVAAAEPVADAAPSSAIVTRVGYGTGAQVAEGEWEAAVEVPPPAPGRRAGRGRRAAPAHTERLAALLGARDAALACEELAIRARADLDHGRHPEAALQLEAALAAALPELACWRDHGDLAARVAELGSHTEPVAAAAAAAREGRLDADGVAAVSAALARLEAALRARAVYATRG